KPRARRSAAAAAPALHAGADHPDDAGGGVQPPPLGRSAGVPLASLRARPRGLERDSDDAGTHREPPRRAPRGRHRGGREAADRGPHRVQPRAHPRARARAAREPRVRMLFGREERVRPAAAAAQPRDGRSATRRPFLTAETPETRFATAPARAMSSSVRTKPVRFTTPSSVSTWIAMPRSAASRARPSSTWRVIDASDRPPLSCACNAPAPNAAAARTRIAIQVIAARCTVRVIRRLSAFSLAANVSQRTEGTRACGEHASMEILFWVGAGALLGWISYAFL